jgi:hypothetical protein
MTGTRTAVRVRTGYITAEVGLPAEHPDPLGVLAGCAVDVDRMLPGGWHTAPVPCEAAGPVADVRVEVSVTRRAPQVTLDPTGRVCVALADATLASATLPYVLYTVAERARQRRGMVTAHAAAALDPAGMAAVLVGDKGAGKTSTLVALLEHGYRFLGDDLVVLTGTDPAGGVGVLPGRRRCAVRQGAGRLGYEAKHIVDLGVLPALDVPPAGFSVATVARVSIHPAATLVVTEPAPLSLTEGLRLAENLARYISGVVTPLATDPVYAPVYPLDDPTAATTRSRLIERIGALGLRYLHAPTAEQAAAAVVALAATPGNPRCA